MNASTTLEGIRTVQKALAVLTTLGMTSHMWPPHAKLPDGTCFDYIVVGAGSAGSVVANRLTEDRNVTVLLLEAGGDPPLEATLPGIFMFTKDTSADWKQESEDDGYTQQFHKNNAPTLTRGKMLGGCSSLNFMLYTRGNYHDYDTWARITGDSSWAWQNVLQYFKKSERLTDPTILNSADAVFHGTNGYMGVTRVHSKAVEKYYKVFEEVGNNIVLDTNNGYSLGYSECSFTISDGVRQSAAFAFLSKIKGRPNLFVSKNTRATRVLFDSKRNAIGVEAILSDNKTVRFKALKEVVLSAGAIGTPKLLMLSGIGPAKHLKDMNIKVISDLPVGHRLQDHVMMMMAHRMGNATPSEPFDVTYFPSPTLLGYATLNKRNHYPDYETANFALNDPTQTLQYCTYFEYDNEICDAIYNECAGKEVLLTFLIFLYPKSRGRILLRSSDPLELPIVHTGYYSNRDDLDTNAKYLQHFARIQNTKYFKSVKSKLIVPKVCECKYDPYRIHEFWKCYALCMMVSGYHFAGSCPMASVVDSRLRVLGVQRLRVADASVMPVIPGANTNAPTIMIGEKASDMIKEDNRCR